MNSGPCRSEELRLAVPGEETFELGDHMTAVWRVERCALGILAYSRTTPVEQPSCLGKRGATGAAVRVRTRVVLWRSSAARVAPCAPSPRLPAAVGRLPGFRVRDADGRGRRRLAGLRDPPSAFDLGLIGLAEFIPLPLLALPAGQMADRMPRVRLFAVSILAEAVIAGLLLLVTIEAHDSSGRS